MTALLAAVFASSLAGSLHCAGMCGGLAAVAAGGPTRRWRAIAAYNGGRLIAYAGLGAIAGGAGGALDVAGALVGVQRLAAVIAGGLIVAWGLAAIARSLGIRLPGRTPSVRAGALAARALARIDRVPGPRRAMALGLVTGLLPCAWLWAFVATAAGTGTWAAGALLMAVFWLGTVPVMAGLGAGALAALGPLRRHAPAVSAAALVALGIFALVGRTSVAPAPAASAARALHGSGVGSEPHGHR